jgi:hypothetical protein
MRLIDNVHVCEGCKPATTAGAKSSDWISLHNYEGVMFIVYIAQGNAASTAITFDKAKTSAGGTNSDGITFYRAASLEDTPQTADTYTAIASAASVTSSTTGSGSSIYLFDFTAAELGEGYDFIQCECGASDAGNLACVVPILYGPRYADEPANQLTGIA